MSEVEDVKRSNAKTVTLSSLGIRMSSVEDGLGAVRKRLNSIEPFKIESTLATLDERASLLAKRFQALILGDCVFSEVGRSCDGAVRVQMVVGLLDAFNEDDDWWLAQREMSIKQWRVLFRK